MKIRDDGPGGDKQSDALLLRVSRVCTLTGCFAFIAGMVRLLPGMPEGNPFFLHAGWLITGGWLLYQWETSERLSGVRGRVTPLLNTAKVYVAPVFVSAFVLFLIAFAVLLFVATD